jgi:hypothetical protein
MRLQYIEDSFIVSLYALTSGEKSTNGNFMERLEKKRIKGHEYYYYYYSIWERINGRCRRVKQIYLGKSQDICGTRGRRDLKRAYAEVFTRGLPNRRMDEACKTNIIEIINEQWPKRTQGLSTGHYITKIHS